MLTKLMRDDFFSNLVEIFFHLHLIASKMAHLLFLDSTALELSLFKDPFIEGIDDLFDFFRIIFGS